MKNTTTRWGVDEAGRGPLLGPLVVATVRVPSDEEWIESSEVKDSKHLTSEQRERLADQISARYNYRAIVISPPEIDHAVNVPTDSLTQLEIRYIKKLLDGNTDEHIIIDAPTRHNPFDKDNIVYEHKADETYKCVGAASIIAKTIRDKSIQRLQEEVGAEIGSGYPSDPTTKEYIETANINQYFIRKSWQPIKDIRANREQQRLTTS